jgi:adhesin transport system membrane fusion protein
MKQPLDSPSPDLESSVSPAKKEPQGLSEAMPLFDHCIDLHCVEQTRLPVSFRRLNRLLVLAFVLLLLALLILPWQQFVRGQGKVTALHPMERSILVEAPLPGRIIEVAVAEGQRVTKGDLLFKIADNDPNLLPNLKEQRSDLVTQREATQAKYQRLSSRIKRLEEALPEARRIAIQQVEAARFAEEAAELQFKRIKSLYDDPRGLSSERDWELARLQRNSKRAETLQAESSLVKIQLDLEASLESARASAEAARSDLAKANKDLRGTSIKINQTDRQSVYAPRDGIVYRLRTTEGTFLKAGSPLCTIIPETNSFVAELWIDGNDMPLVREREVDADGNITQQGSPARLQFEGWPAIQFVGWPSVAVGTFGGEVIFVDAIDNGRGLFRVLVAPAPDQIVQRNGEKRVIEWPGEPIMRQGIQTQGWVLLERVPLWFEVWRQLNGFPPARDRESDVAPKSKP